MRVPLALLTVPYLAAAVAGVVLADTTPEALRAGTAASAVLALVSGIGFYLEQDPRGVAAAVLTASACAGFGSGAATSLEAYRPPLLAWFETTAGAGDEPVLVEGRLREDAAGAGPVLSIAVTHVTPSGGSRRMVSGGIRAYVGGAAEVRLVAAWRASRPVRAPVLLRIPGTFANPGVPDDRRLLARRGTVLTGTIKSAALVEVAAASWFAEASASVRSRVRRTLTRHVGSIDPRSAAVATAVLIGDRTGLPDEDERRLQDAGTYHVIAISGGNIAILTVALLTISRIFGLPRRLSAAVTAALLLFYGEIAGGSASVERAIAAAVLILGARILDHRGSSLNVLSAAALVGVASAPLMVLDAGFLLSFGATAGIVFGVHRIVRPTADHGGSSARRALETVRHAAAGVLAATICADVVLLPIVATLFSRVTAAGLVLNLAAIPLMTIVQCGAMVLVALDGWTTAAAPVARIVHHAAAGLIDSARIVEVTPWLVRDVRPPMWWLCAGYYIALALSLATRRRVPWVLTSVVSAALIVGSPDSTSRADVPRRAPQVLRVTILDVGQGDAVLVSAPGAHHVLVDTGGLPGSSFDIGTRVLGPALGALEVGRLDGLVLTHADPDHTGGAEVLLRRFNPVAVWEGITVPPHEGLRRLAAIAGSRGITWRTVRPGTIDRWGEVELRVLHPAEPDWERQRVRNDDSVVLEVRYRDVSILLPGDIGAAVERTLVSRLRLAPLVVLKAAHHGSATSSSELFLDAVRPGAVVFSAGRNNRFGHPAPVVVQRYERRGVPMFNTATDGAVFVETDGRGVEVRGWSSRRVLTIDGQPQRR